MKTVFYPIALIVLIGLTGCRKLPEAHPTESISAESPKELSNISETPVSEPESGLAGGTAATDSGDAESVNLPSDTNEAEIAVSDSVTQDSEVSEPEILKFLDAYKEEYSVEINRGFPFNDYNVNSFIHDGNRVTYDDDKYTSRYGIDVSHHQGNAINWKEVAKSGVEFAIIRVAYRGYTYGDIHADKYGISNIKKALEEGLDVGVYIFSQAINEEEALAEAEFVTDLLAKNNITPEMLTMPVVFDPESIRKDEARTDNISGEQFTKNTRVFCDAIKAAGFSPCVYSNMLWEAYMLDLEALSDIPVWYADYEPLPQTPYAFTMWQYSESITVPGIAGRVDGNVQLIPRETN